MLLTALSCLVIQAVYGFRSDVSLHGESGLKVQVQDQPGISQVYVSIQQTNGVITDHAATKQPTSNGKKWIYLDNNSGVNPGDKVSYRTNVVYNGDLVTSEWYEDEATYPLELVRSMRSHTVFRDDFTTWSPDHYNIIVTANRGGNNEFQVYTNRYQNLYVKEGKLYIAPTETVNDAHFDENKLYHGRMDVKGLWGECDYSWNWGCDRTAATDILPPIMSGRIRTHAAIRYGRVNVRAKLPLGDWIWPAIWLLSKDEKYGQWPKSGEIDIMESRGNLWMDYHDNKNHAITQVSSTLHWGTSPEQNKHDMTHNSKQKWGGGNWHDDFHVYSLEWTDSHIITYVDNVEIMHVRTPGNGFWGWGGFHGNNIWSSGGKNAPFDQYFQLILNVAVGGDFFPDGARYSHPKPWSQRSPHPMRDFWERRGEWQKTWFGEEACMAIDYVEMIQY
ncbi:hypothetical protein FSP39_005385 [Pinctada imbricata]|uniref:GH16 domain-containing protein n=1 Tax=Pinctada imbricata TaxID=66713 RepID=A0AA88XKE1_PINIB|nr:hypothetical protein FSP39_005385 [Pinctada imbricata]